MLRRTWSGCKHGQRCSVQGRREGNLEFCLACPSHPDVARNGAWMQLGVINEGSAERARAAGLEVVMDACVKLEHARFRGGLNLLGLNTGVISSRR